MDKADLVAFEEEIKDLFLAKQIRAPVHLSRGNEEQLIEIFEKVKSDDWVFSTHRSHYHALLKGIDPQWLKNEILMGKSMHIFNREHKFFTSAIVGGICPIAVGVALGIKKKGEKHHVWCFIGDMAYHMGIFHESKTYAENFDLPITFVIEDNGLSAETPTESVWGFEQSKSCCDMPVYVSKWASGGVMFYHYERGFPHCGVGKWVTF